ncbi:MAG: zf-TFIIB domain-containing protein [Fimbriimonadia bacterium]|nr:zf-TFIIB domain-containing protein [Fimbriimonadia bacterium]
MNKLCPKCNGAMIEQNVDHVAIDVCSLCAGIWFDDEELTQLMSKGHEMVAKIDQRYRPAQEGGEAQPFGQLLCPSCRDPLERYNYLYTTPIELDTCPKCNGVFVDDGELEAMIAVLAEAKMQEVPTDVVDDLEIIKVEADHRERVGRLRTVKGFSSFLSARLRWPL